MRTIGQRATRGLLGSLLLAALLGLAVFSGGGDGMGGLRSIGQRARSKQQLATRAYVTRVIDGDTIEVKTGGHEEDVRYVGIDTPETVKPGTPVQCFGPQASAENHRLVERRAVRLVFDRERRDIYGRLLAYVYLPHLFVNARLVRLGYARTLAIPPNVEHAALFGRLALAAGRAGRGLWGPAC